MPDRITQSFTRFLRSLGSDRAADGRPIGDVLQPTLEVSGWYRDAADLPPGTSLWHCHLTSPGPAAANYGTAGIQAQERPLIVEVVTGIIVLKLIDYSIRQTEEGGLFANWLGAGPVTVTPESFIGATPNALIQTSAAGGGLAPGTYAVLRATGDPRLTAQIHLAGLPSAIGGFCYLPPGAHVVFLSTVVNDTCDQAVIVREMPAPGESP